MIIGKWINSIMGSQFAVVSFLKKGLTFIHTKYKNISIVSLNLNAGYNPLQNLGAIVRKIPEPKALRYSLHSWLCFSAPSRFQESLLSLFVGTIEVLTMGTCGSGLEGPLRTDTQHLPHTTHWPCVLYALILSPHSKQACEGGPLRMLSKTALSLNVQQNRNSSSIAVNKICRVLTPTQF